MRILAIETTEKNGALAAMNAGNILSEKRLDRRGRSAQTLAPEIKSLLHRVRWKPEDVDLVAVCIGPGSFTGLRVGLATAKTFAYCVHAELIGVNTLEVIASAAPNEVKELSVGMDVQRGEVIAGWFRRTDDNWFKAICPPEILPIEDWLERARQKTILTGPILHQLTERMPTGVQALDPKYWSPTASSVARFAAWQYQNGQRDDVFSLAPLYSRLAAAEEKYEREHREQ